MSRRAFLTRAASLGAGAAALAACGRNDAAVFSQAGSTTTSRPPGSSSTTSSRPSTTSTPSSTAASTTSTAPPSTSTTAAPSGDAVHGELVTKFTYAVRSGGRVNNPYVAVWVEDADGKLVDTIALWYLQSQKGNRWLPELRRWYPASSSTRGQVVSSATRAPGSYSVTWDCTDAQGAAVAAGPYFLCIEAAREHGPYSLIRQSITLGSQAFTVDLPANGELSDASATFTPH